MPPEDEGLEGQQAALTEGEGERQPGATGEQGDKGAVPYHRFTEVNTKLKTALDALEKYQKLGDPAKIEAEMSRLKELSEANEFTPKEKEMISKQLFTLFPGLKNLVDNADKIMRAAGAAEMQKENYISTVERQTNGYLGKLGLATNQKNNERLQELLVAELRQPENKQKMVAFLRGDHTVLDEMFKVVQREVFGGRRIAEAADLQGRKQIPTSKPQPRQQQKPQNNGEAKSANQLMNDAHEAAAELMAQME